MRCFKKIAWYDKYVKIRKYTSVLYPKVEHIRICKNIPLIRITCIIETLVFLGFRVIRVTFRPTAIYRTYASAVYFCII